MVMSTRFRINGDLFPCPDPNEATWDFMEPLESALSGRRVQQGNMRVTLDWDLMTDGEYGRLVEFWVSRVGDGYRVDSAKVPPFQGYDNADWVTVTGQFGTKLAMLRPTARRTIMHASGVRLIFEDVAMPLEA